MGHSAQAILGHLRNAGCAWLADLGWFFVYMRLYRSEPLISGIGTLGCEKL